MPHPACAASKAACALVEILLGDTPKAGKLLGSVQLGAGQFQRGALGLQRRFLAAHRSLLLQGINLARMACPAFTGSPDFAEDMRDLAFHLRLQGRRVARLYRAHKLRRIGDRTDRRTSATLMGHVIAEGSKRGRAAGLLHAAKIAKVPERRTS